jgi:hypothetical protein
MLQFGGEQRGYCFVSRLFSLPWERRQVSAQSDGLSCVSGAHNFWHSAMLSDGVLRALPELLIPPVAGLGTRPVLEDEGSCAPMPFCSAGLVVVALGS